MALFGGTEIGVSASTISYGSQQRLNGAGDTVADAVNRAVLGNSDIPKEILMDLLYNNHGIDLEKYYQEAKNNYPEFLPVPTKLREVAQGVQDGTAEQAFKEAFGVDYTYVSHSFTGGTQAQLQWWSGSFRYVPDTSSDEDNSDLTYNPATLEMYSSPYGTPSNYFIRFSDLTFSEIVNNRYDSEEGRYDKEYIYYVNYGFEYVNKDTGAVNTNGIRDRQILKKFIVSSGSSNPNNLADGTALNLVMRSPEGDTVTWLVLADDPKWQSFLDIVTEVTPENDFYPVIPIKKNNKYIWFLSDDGDTPNDDSDDTVTYGFGKDYYDSCSVLARHLGLSAKALAKQLRATSNAQGGDAEVNAGYMYIGVDVNSDTEESARYYWDFFSDYFEDSNNVVGKEYIELNDSSSNLLDMQIQHQGITSGFTTIADDKKEYYKVLDGTKLKLYKRDVGNRYHELVIDNPTHETVIYKSYSQITNLVTAANGNQFEGSFRLPLSRDIYQSYGGRAKHRLALESTSLYIAAYTKLEYEWYEDPDFWKLVSIVVSIIVLVFTWVDGGYTAANVFSFLWALGVKLVIGYVIAEGALWLVEEIGGDLGKFVALVASVVALYYTGAFDGVGFADGAVAVVGAIVQIEQASIASDMAQLQQEIYAHNQAIEAAMEHNKEIADSISTVDESVARVILETTLLPNETPDIFYSRTINLNPNEAVIGQIGSFIGQNLDLPQPDMLDSAYFNDSRDLFR